MCRSNPSKQSEDRSFSIWAGKAGLLYNVKVFVGENVGEKDKRSSLWVVLTELLSHDKIKRKVKY